MNVKTIQILIMEFFTRKRLILTFFLILEVFETIDCSPETVTGYCGDPGRPVKSQLSPTQISYNEGETIVYTCDDYISLKQYRKCVKGKWVGLNPICGNSFRNNDLKTVRILNRENGKLIRRYDLTNMDPFTKFGNSFIAERFAIPVRASGSKSYKFKLYLNYTEMFQLVRISLSVVNHLTDERVRGTKFNITRVTVSPYRECVLNTHSSVSPWLHNSTRFDYWFSCESKDDKSFEEELKNMSDLVTIETESDDILDLDLATFILAQQYTNGGNPREPLCGTPEIPVGLESLVINHQTKYAFKCAQGFKRLDHFGGDTHELVCGTDMKWKGSLPLCFPIKICDKFRLSDKHLTEVYLYEKVYYHNTSLWFAIEGTKAYFRCKNEIQIFIGKDFRVCGKDGEWSESSPNCLNTQINQNESKLNLTSISLIIVITLILTFSLTALLIYCFMKMKVRSKSKSSRNSNIYADYDSTGDEPKPFDTELYETVNDERYANNKFMKTTPYMQVNGVFTDYDDCIQYNAGQENNIEDSYVVMKSNSN